MKSDASEHFEFSLGENQFICTIATLFMHVYFIL